MSPPATARLHPVHVNFHARLDAEPGAAFDAVEYIANAGKAHPDTQ